MFLFMNKQTKEVYQEQYFTKRNGKDWWILFKLNDEIIQTELLSLIRCHYIYQLLLFFITLFNSMKICICTATTYFPCILIQYKCRNLRAFRSNFHESSWNSSIKFSLACTCISTFDRETFLRQSKVVPL